MADVGHVDPEYIERGVAKMTEVDAQRVVAKTEAIAAKVKSSGPLRALIDDVRLMLSMVGDYVSGEYREVPWNTIAAIVFALLYVLSPLDLIPDFIPVAGMLDDFTVVVFCLRLTRRDIQAYGEWKASRTADQALAKTLRLVGRGDIHISEAALAEFVRTLGRSHAAELEWLGTDGESTLTVRANVSVPVLGEVVTRLAIGIEADAMGRACVDLHAIKSPLLAKPLRGLVADRIRRSIPVAPGLTVGEGMRLLIVDLSAAVGAAVPRIRAVTVRPEGIAIELGADG